MLVQLAIRDIVLIDRIDFDPDRGLTVLTGETGAGKSILLDATSLALGEGQIEPVDQDDVADRKLDEHGRFACFRQRGGTGAGGFGSARARNGLSRTEVERKAGQPVMRRKARLIHEPVSSRGVRPCPWISA